MGLEFLNLIFVQKCLFQVSSFYEIMIYSNHINGNNLCFGKFFLNFY